MPELDRLTLKVMNVFSTGESSLRPGDLFTNSLASLPLVLDMLQCKMHVINVKYIYCDLLGPTHRSFSIKYARARVMNAKPNTVANTAITIEKREPTTYIAQIMSTLHMAALLRPNDSHLLKTNLPFSYNQFSAVSQPHICLPLFYILENE